MRYENIVKGKFISRPNRFIAMVELEPSDVCANSSCEQTEIHVKAHVKNTGRLGELLIPGAEVYLEDHAGRMGSRKLRYSLITVRKTADCTDSTDSSCSRGQLVNIDSQAPNKVVKEAIIDGNLLPKGLKDIAYYKSEHKYGNSRLDFYAEDSDGNKLLGEVKGVTLEEGGIAKFPDAPTERGIKHIEELIKAVEEGYKACIVFVIKMKGVHTFRPNYDTHPEFGEALKKARDAGVEVLAYDCIVAEDNLVIDGRVDVIL